MTIFVMKEYVTMTPKRMHYDCNKGAHDDGFNDRLHDDDYKERKIEMTTTPMKNKAEKIPWVRM